MVSKEAKLQLIHQTTNTYVVIMVFFLAGLLLHMLDPFPIIDSPYLRLGGFLCLILGSYLIYRARLVRQRLYTQTEDNRYRFPEDVYHYSRHPIYLSVIIIFIGVAFAINSAFFLVLTALLMGVLTTVMIPQEERILLGSPENNYSEYMQQVRMWF